MSLGWRDWIRRDKGLLFLKRLAEKGMPTNVTLFPGVPHRFRRFRGTLKEYVRCDKVQEGGIKWILSKPATTGEFAIKD